MKSAKSGALELNHSCSASDGQTLDLLLEVVDVVVGVYAIGGACE